MWQSALSECNELTLAGYNDWRLPSQRELKSIVDYTVKDPAVNEEYFPNTVSSLYMSSTTSADSPIFAWGVYFHNGSDSWNLKSDSNYVRAVRGGQDWLLGHLIISAPSQSSVWKWGDTMPIRWDTSGIGGNVSISISRQGGKAGTFETIIGSTANDGAYDWTVAGPNSVNCVLKIEPANDPTKGTMQGLFSIEAVKHSNGYNRTHNRNDPLHRSNRRKCDLRRRGGGYSQRRLLGTIQKSDHKRQ